MSSREPIYFNAEPELRRFFADVDCKLASPASVTKAEAEFACSLHDYIERVTIDLDHPDPADCLKAVKDVAESIKFVPFPEFLDELSLCIDEASRGLEASKGGQSWVVRLVDSRGQVKSQTWLSFYADSRRARSASRSK